MTTREVVKTIVIATAVGSALLLFGTFVTFVEQNVAKPTTEVKSTSGMIASLGWCTILFNDVSGANIMYVRFPPRSDHTCHMEDALFADGSK